MEKEDLLKILEEDQVFYLSNKGYESEYLSVNDGYLKVGDYVAQVSRIEIDYNTCSANIKSYVMMDKEKSGHDILLIEARGIDIWDSENDKLTEPDGLYSLADVLVMCIDPRRKITTRYLEKVIEENEDFVGREFIERSKGKIYLYWDTFLHQNPDIFKLDEFLEDTLVRMNEAAERYKKRKSMDDMVENSKTSPIYEVWERGDEEFEMPKKSAGLYYNEKLSKLIQFVIEDGDDYSRNEYYFYYEDNGEVKEIVSVKSIPSEYAKKYKLKMDLNHLSDTSPKSNEASYIRSLFKGIDDQDFISNTWEKLSIIKDKKEIEKFEIHEYDKDYFVSMLANGDMRRSDEEDEDDYDDEN